MKLTIPFHRQDTDYSCGAASLQMLLHHINGTYPSEDELMRRMHTSKESGTHHDELIRVLQEEGLYVYTHNEATLEMIENCIRAEFPVFVHFIEPDGEEEHYAVVVGFTKERIYLNDPWNGSGFSVHRDEFDERWHHNQTGRYRRWLLTVSKYPAFPHTHFEPLV